MQFRQIHLDFHTSEAIPDVGKDFDKAQFQEGLKAAHADSITLFSKCHHGWSYHPTKANVMHPSLKFDLLSAQVEACRELGIRTPIYISAGLDEKCAVEHPEWLVRFGDESLTWAASFDEPGFHRLCFNTGYLDTLIAQIREVMELYNPPEIFLDICTPPPCLCSRCRADMKKKGLDPKKPADVMAQAEDVYAAYTARVRATVDEYNKDCAVIHNFGHLHCGRRDYVSYQSHLELESLPTGGWGYDDFPFSALYAAGLGKEYLGMTGKFHKSWGEFGGFKHPNALRYETSLAAALGAGSSIGSQLHPCGKADMTTCRLIGQAYSELEKKEKWCKNTSTVADIALLSSEAVGVAVGRNVERIADIGANRMLLEGKYLYTVIDAQSDFSPYKLLILPDNCRLDRALAEKLNKYLAGGGKLLASGRSCLELDSDSFAVDLGVAYKGKNEFSPTYLVSDGMLENNNGVLLMYADSHLFGCGRAKRVCGLQNPYFNRTPEHFCSHIHAPNNLVDAGPGAAVTENTAYIGWEIFTDYANMGALQCKQLVCALIEKLIGDKKTLRTDLPDRGIATLRRAENGDLIAHLLFAHTTRRGKDTEVIEDIVPLHNVLLQVKTDSKPTSVTLVPDNKPLEFTYENGVCAAKIDEFSCHAMVEIKL